MAATFPENPAFTYLIDGEEEGDKHTYASLLHRVETIASELIHRRLNSERVLIALPPGMGFIETFLACTLAGSIAVPCSAPRNREDDWTRFIAIAKDCGAQAIVTTNDFVEKYAGQAISKRLLQNLICVCLDKIPESKHDKDVLPTTYSDKNIAFLQYTSGSTGNPKGVIVTHKNIAHNLTTMQNHMQLPFGSSGVSWLPPFHDMGLIGGILLPIWRGMHSIHMTPASFVQKPIRWIKAISKYQSVISASPNFGYQLCSMRCDEAMLEGLDLSHWKVACNAAEPINPDFLDLFYRRFSSIGFKLENYLCGYGLAENTLIVSGQKRHEPPTILTINREKLAKNIAFDFIPDTDEKIPEGKNNLGQKIVGCGPVDDDQNVKIVDPKTHKECSEDGIGEIWVQSDSVAQGYWGKPELSKESFKACLAGMQDDYYFRTGDLGFMRNKEIYITGRIKDLIVIRGRNIYPQDVESEIVKSHSALYPNSCACFSISDGDGEHIVAVVEVKRTHRNVADTADIFSAIRARVSEYFQLSLHACVLIPPTASLKTSSGKIRRQETRVLYLNNTLKEIVSWHNQAIPLVNTDLEKTVLIHREELDNAPPYQRKQMLLDALLAWIETRLGSQSSPLDTSANMFELGLDSVLIVEMSTLANELFSLSLTSDFIFENPTLSNLADALLDIAYGNQSKVSTALDVDNTVSVIPNNEIKNITTTSTEKYRLSDQDIDALSDSEALEMLMLEIES